ncbi:MAG: hypothetical protein ABJA66_11350 [Actinomycetota bacterium]
MNPSVYLFRESKKGIELYFGEFSTLDGLSCLNQQTKAQITRFGATGYKEFGWATENELPALNTVAEIIEFLKSKGEIGIIDIEVKIQNVGLLSTHDDSECHFTLLEKSQILAILEIAAPLAYSGLIFNKLIENPAYYMTFDEFGKMNKYETFDNYLAAANI